MGPATLRRMCRRTLPALAAACLVVTGCSDKAPSLTPFAGDASDARVLINFPKRIAAANEVRHRPVLEVGGDGWQHAAVAGWAAPEVHRPTGGAMAWAIEEAAVVELFLLDTDFDSLEIRGRALAWDGGPEQRMTVKVNGRRVGRVTLSPLMSDVALAISPEQLAIGSNRVELRFDWLAKPSELTPGSSDHRRLAAAFQRIALTSSRRSGATAGTGGGLAVDGDRLRLPAGVGVRMPLSTPDGAFAEIAGIEALAPHQNGSLLVWLEDASGRRSPIVTIDTAATAAGPARFAIGRPGEAPVRLVMVADPDGAGVAVVRPRVRGRVPVDAAVPNVVLLVVDTLRADYLGVYGGDTVTPVIDRLAAKGVRFARARSHIPITGPSHSSLFTSLLPMEHGVRNNAQHLRSTLPSLPEALRAQGRSTAAVVSLGVLNRSFGFDRGFEVYGDDFPRDWLKDAVEVTDEALELADTALAGPYFLWVHYSDPHEPYAPLGRKYPVFDIRIGGESVGTIDARGRGFWLDVTVPPGDSDFDVVPAVHEPERVFRIDNLNFHDDRVTYEPLDGWRVINRRLGRMTLESSFPAKIRLSNESPTPVETRLLISCKELLGKTAIREAYSREVEIVDREIGRLLAGLEERGMMAGTLVVFASDHGEGLGDHNHVGHISQLYDSLLHVPLIFSWPGRLPEGLVVDDPVSLVDVYPTLAELLRLDPPAVTSGASLVPLLRGGSMPERAVIAATYRPESFSDKRAIVVDGHKYIHSWRDDREWEELFDVGNDPGELVDLCQTEPELLDRLRRELAARLAAMAESESLDAELSDEDRAQLEALGYIH